LDAGFQKDMAKLFNDNKGDQQFILNELLKGNERAFDTAFKQYYKPLCQFSYSLIKDQDTAENLVQEVFVKLWEKRKNLTDIDNLFSYLVGMVRNQSIDFLRKEKTSSKIYNQLRPEKSENTTEEQISKNEFEEKLLKSIVNLPDRCRTAIEMSRFEGLSNKEIAQQMNISVKGVEALIGRSLKLLRIDLKEFLPAFSPEKPGSRSAVFFSILLSKLKGLEISTLN
jgi:RNA polymerase sigma-70 factor (ECF subfamily)